MPAVAFSQPETTKQTPNKEKRARRYGRLMRNRRKTRIRTYSNEPLQVGTRLTACHGVGQTKNLPCDAKNVVFCVNMGYS